MGRTSKKAAKEKKLIITFDEEARRNYLTGFSKRKKLRKKQAKAEELKKELAEKKEKRAEKRSTLKQTMVRHNLLDTRSANDDHVLPTDCNVTTQHYSGTTVTISDIPALEARTKYSAPTSIENSAKTQTTSTTNSDKEMLSIFKPSQQLGKLRNKSKKKLRKLKK